MPLPFVLIGAAVAAAGYGAKKGYDGYQDKSLAEDITKKSKEKYDNEKMIFDYESNETNQLLEKLGALQLQIGQDFHDFRKIADALLQRLAQKRIREDLKISIPQHRLDKIKVLEISALNYLGQMASAGIAGGAAAYAVYGGVMAFAAASTGTPIAALSGVAAYNATLAAIGGGSLAAGGFGMAGGAMILGGVVAAPIAAIAGYAYASHAEKALEHARKTRAEIDDAVAKMELAQKHFKDTQFYAYQIWKSTNEIYQVFSLYFDRLKAMNSYIEIGGNIEIIEDEILRAIDNGYKVAAILTDIIMTPLFKPKSDVNGAAVLGKDNAILIETNSDGLQVINKEAIMKSLNAATEAIKLLTIV